MKIIFIVNYTMKRIIEKLNKVMGKLAELLSDALSSMTMFWIIALLVIVPLFWVQPKDAVSWMQYIVSVFFQGVALPVLGYTSKLSGKRTDEVISKIEELSKKIEQQTAHIEKDVDEIIEEVVEIKDEIESK